MKMLRTPKVVYNEEHALPRHLLAQQGSCLLGCPNNGCRRAEHQQKLCLLHEQVRLLSESQPVDSVLERAAYCRIVADSLRHLGLFSAAHAMQPYPPGCRHL